MQQARNLLPFELPEFALKICSYHEIKFHCLANLKLKTGRLQPKLMSLNEGNDQEKQACYYYSLQRLHFAFINSSISSASTGIFFIKSRTPVLVITTLFSSLIP